MNISKAPLDDVEAFSESHDDVETAAAKFPHDDVEEDLVEEEPRVPEVKSLSMMMNNL